jgi:hypothetical protein
MEGMVGEKGLLPERSEWFRSRSVTGNDMAAFLPVPRLMQGTSANVVRRE